MYSLVSYPPGFNTENGKWIVMLLSVLLGNHGNMKENVESSRDLAILYHARDY